MAKQSKEHIIENILRDYHTYQIGLNNCQMQLDYIMPTMVSHYQSDGSHSTFYISNNTEKVAIDRIESKRALDLKEEIEKNKLILESIDRAVSGLNDEECAFVKWRYFYRLPVAEVKSKMHIAEDKTFYKIRRKTLEQLTISLSNLIFLK